MSYLQNITTVDPANNSQLQHLVNIIFRRNGDYFFAAERPHDVQLNFDFLLPNISSCEVMQPQYDSEILAPDHPLTIPENQFTVLDGYSESLLDWFIDEIAGENSLATFSTMPTNSLLAKPEPVQTPHNTEHYIKLTYTIIESLSVCKFCRSRRIKCSRTLPSCHNCVDYKIECEYFEPSSVDVVSGR
jgi:Fungal Zn(2)-Cys(6) binuclear cluster domain